MNFVCPKCGNPDLERFEKLPILDMSMKPVCRCNECDPVPNYFTEQFLMDAQMKNEPDLKLPFK